MKEKIKNFLKLIPEFIYYGYLINGLKKKKVANVILGTPVHENMGDHLITYAEKEYIKKELGVTNFVEIPIEAYKLFKQKLIRNIPNEATIFINGGGWMGNIWPNDELLLEDMVCHFPNNRIVIFPQSIYFDKEKEDCEYIIAHSIKTFENRDQCILCLRDARSFEVAKQLYPALNVKLVPDITLYLCGDSLFDVVSVPKRSQIVGVCLRSDREMSRNGSLIEECLTWCEGQNFARIQVSTVKKMRVPSFARKYALHRLVNKYKQCQFIITDRLHGMIFSYLCGVPCIVFDNATGKISSLYNTWLKNCKGIYMVRGTEENLPQKTEMLLNTENARKIHDTTFDFSALKNAISKMGDKNG